MRASWLALVVGNTRLHWGQFDRGVLTRSWHTSHLPGSRVDRVRNQPYPQSAWLVIDGLVSEQRASASPQNVSLPIDLWIASVVPEQTALWQQVVPDSQVVSRSHIRLKNIYPTLGIDRAINLLGAKQILSWPILVIDGGTALTFTAGVADSVYGGAILPGIRLQLQSLVQQTAELGYVLGSLMPTMLTGTQLEQSQLPERWASNTDGAIASGIVYSTISTCVDYIADWWQQFPTGAVVLTGGDGPLLYQYLQQRTPEVASRVLVDSDLMFKGMQAYRRELTT
ncbi:MAG: pantothenate kinase [Phormidesmis sp.]